MSRYSYPSASARSRSRSPLFVKRMGSDDDLRKALDSRRLTDISHQSPNQSFFQEERSYQYEVVESTRSKSPGREFFKRFSKVGHHKLTKKSPKDDDDEDFPNGRRFPHKIENLSQFFNKLDDTWRSADKEMIADIPNADLDDPSTTGSGILCETKSEQLSTSRGQPPSHRMPPLEAQTPNHSATKYLNQNDRAKQTQPSSTVFDIMTNLMEDAGFNTKDSNQQTTGSKKNLKRPHLVYIDLKEEEEEDQDKSRSEPRLNAPATSSQTTEKTNEPKIGLKPWDAYAVMPQDGQHNPMFIDSSVSKLFGTKSQIAGEPSQNANQTSASRLKTAAQNLANRACHSEKSKIHKFNADIPEPGQLKQGNYLLGALDLQIWTDRLGHGHLIQVGCAISPSETDSFGKWILPTEVDTKDLPYRQVNYTEFVFLKSYENMRLQEYKCGMYTSAEDALKTVLNFFEKCCKRVRPIYEGIILITYNRDTLRLLLSNLRKFPIVLDNFKRIVKGFVCLETYMKVTRPPKVYPQQASEDYVYTYDLLLTCMKTLGKHCLGYSGDNSQKICEILVKLLDANPTYQNFFSKYCHSIDSAFFKYLCPSGVVHPKQSERLAKYRTLQTYLSNELFNYENQILVIGMKDARLENQFLSRSEWLAQGIIRLLLNCCIEMDDLIQIYEEHGMEGLDFKLQTDLLEKSLIDSSSGIKEQTLKAVNIVKEFFGNNLYLPDETISTFVILKPSRVPFKVWNSYKSLIEYIKESFPEMKDDPEFKIDVKALIATFTAAGLDHNSLFKVWQSGNGFAFFLKTILYNKKSPLKCPKPIHLKTDRIIELLQNYFQDHPGTFCETSQGSVSLLDTYDPVAHAIQAIGRKAKKPNNKDGDEKEKHVLKSLVTAGRYISLKLRPMAYMTAGTEFHVNQILQLFYTLMASFNLTCNTLKYLTINGELNQTLTKYFNSNLKWCIPPFFDPDNLTKLITDFVYQNS